MREYTNSRGKLIQACIELLIQAGPGQISVEAVAKQAGISKGGLFHNFKSRKDLLQNVMTNLVQEINAQIAQKITIDPNPHGRFLRSYLSVFLENERAGSRIHKAVINCWIEIHRTEIDLKDEFKLFFDSYLDKMQDDALPLDTVLLISASLDGIMLGLLKGQQFFGTKERQLLVQHLIRLTLK